MTNLFVELTQNEEAVVSGGFVGDLIDGLFTKKKQEIESKAIGDITNSTGSILAQGSIGEGTTGSIDQPINL